MRVILTLLLLVASLGCDRSEPDTPAPTPDATPAAPTPSTASAPPTPAEPEPEAPPAPADDRPLPSLAPAALDRAGAAMTAAPKMRKSLSTDAPGLDTMRALSVQWRAPTWADDAGSLDAVDDDDNRTVWSCGAATCGVGTPLDEGTRLHAVRWVGSDTALDTVRVHTDAGFADVGPLPARRSRWLVFDPPVATTKLVFEASALSVGDVEVFGSGGLPKAPSTFDPTQAAVAPEDPWAELAQWRLRAEVCLEHGSTCEIRGTAALGTPTGRLALIEAIHRTD